MVLALLRRGLGRAITSQPMNTRSMADTYVPKPDTSMDHVFGDNSVRLPHNVGSHRSRCSWMYLHDAQGQMYLLVTVHG